MLKNLIKKLENWKEVAEKNPYSGLKESAAYERVLRELREVQTNYEIKERIMMLNVSEACGQKEQR